MIQSVCNSSDINREEEFQREDWSSAYCNVEKELNNFPLKASHGYIPEELYGYLYKNGPGRLERAGEWVHHPFDGDGMILGIHFNKGSATFNNRFVRTKGWIEEEEKGKFIYRGVFGTQKKGGFLTNAFDLRMKNIANTHIVKLGEELLALWEASSPHSLDPLTLETNGISSLNGVLGENEAFSAHPRFDPGHHGSKRMVTFGVKAGPKSTIRLFEFEGEGDNEGDLISDRKDTFNGFAFLHDFAITPNWAIFLQNAVSFNPLPFILGNKGAAQCLSSEKSSVGKFWLIPRDSGQFSGGEPLIFDAPKGFVFHHLNAYEENEKIIIDSIFYNDFPTIPPNTDFKKINFELIPEGILSRCEINTVTGKVKSNELSRQCCEFAMVNPNHQGSNAKYSWMATSQKAVGNAPLQAIKKLNLSSLEECYWSAAPRGFVSEPIMVPREGAENEDDGWVFTLVWNGERRGTDLIILKANDLSEQAILELPIAIPHGLHGSWVNS